MTQVPPDWEGRLEQLGFKRTQTGWARLGAVTQSEITYISPDIDLIGFASAEPIDAPSTDESNSVPIEVRDEVLRVWQRQYDALQIAISLEVGKRLSKGAVWTYVEDAIAGRLTPESESVLSLAIESLRPRGLSDEIVEFERSLESWRSGSGVDQPKATGSLLISQGSTVKWATPDGIVQTGRLARPLYTTDTTFVTFEVSPRWVGGYPVVSPKRLSRSRLFFDSPAHDFSDDDLLIPVAGDDSTEVNELTSAVGDELVQELPVEAVNDETKRLITRLLLSGVHLEKAEPGWEQLIQAYLANKTTQAQAVAGVTWVGSVLDQLDRVRMSYMENLPYSVGLTAQHGVDAPIYVATVAVEIGGVIYRSYKAPALELDNIDTLDLDDIGGQLRSVIEDRRKQFNGSAESLAAAVGRTGKKIPTTAINSHLEMLKHAADMLGTQLTDAYLNDILALSLHSPSLIDIAPSKRLEQGLDITTYRGSNLEYVAGVHKIEADLFDLTHIGSLMRLEGRDFNLELLPIDCLEAYSTGVLFGEKVERPVLPEGVSVKPEGARSLNRFDWPATKLFTDRNAAAGVYRALLESLGEGTTDSNKARIEQAVQISKTANLLEQVLDVPNKLAAMPSEQLYALVEADFCRLGGKKAESIAGTYRKRLLDSVINAAKKPTTWAVCLEIKSRNCYTHQITVERDLMGESREAVLSKATARVKSRGGRSTVLAFDSLAWADPALAARLSGAEAGAAANAGEKPNKPETGAYSDTGVVAGWAMKDLRAMNKDQFLGAVAQMSDAQKKSYISKELLWPRKSFAEMKEDGVDVQVAALHDLVWKTVPASPKSLVRTDIAAYAGMIEHFKGSEKSLGSTLETYLNDLAELARDFASTTASDSYSIRDLRFRGTGCSLYSMIYKDTLARKVKDADWSEIIKEKKRSSAPTSGSRVMRNAVVREGIDHRKGVSVTGEDFIRTFGFSGVEYGNWTNQKEREKHLNFAYDSMMDFADAMGWEPMVLSLGGRLGLCIGSRGRGGSRAASAHFETVNMAINLTRMRGDGALAHEFFHAVANHYGRLYSGKPTDLVDAIAYPLREKSLTSTIPPTTRGDLRQSVVEGFYKFMTAVMRSPAEGSDVNCLNDYLSQSEMLINSLKEDGSKTPYWSQPAELFARAAETCFAKILEEQGKRNDYLVRYEKGMSGGVYPSNEHLVNLLPHFKRLTGALKTDVQRISHPFLGDIQMPVLNTEIYSRNPLTTLDLATLAEDRLATLFKSLAPSLEVFDSGLAMPGYYQLAERIIGLNARYADEETFHHESWHAAYHILLTRSEQERMDSIFDPAGALASKVALALREAGHVGDIDSMLSDSQEVQAYAYQLWAVDKLTLDDSPREFARCKRFTDEILEVEDIFGESMVESIFERFRSGQLAIREEERLSGRANKLHEFEGDWDSDNIVWNPDAKTQRHSSQLGM